MPYDPGPDFGRLRDEAQRAPSIFNTRPWWFEYRPPDHIDLWLRPVDIRMDKVRAREYVISCGAALFNLRLAIRVAGHDLAVWLLPKPRYADPMRPPTLLASAEIVTGRIKKAGIWEQELYEAIERRHTNRQPYRILPAPLPIITAMEDAAAQEGAYLRLLHPREARRWMRRAAKVGPTPAPFPNNVNHADYGPPPKKPLPANPAGLLARRKAQFRAQTATDGALHRRRYDCRLAPSRPGPGARHPDRNPLLGVGKVRPGRAVPRTAPGRFPRTASPPEAG